MSGVSLPVDRKSGRALVVGGAECRALAAGVLGHLGYQLAEFEEPYAAMAELARRPNGYRALILSLNSVYREELQIIAAVVGRFPQVEIWLTHTDGRPSALAEAMRLGAHGLLSEEGLHRFAVVPEPDRPQAIPVPTPMPTAAEPKIEETALPEMLSGEAILTAEELRALLDEQPAQAHQQ